MQRVLEVHTLARVEVKPAVFLGIPSHAQRLQATFADLDQVLLQWRDAEGVDHLEVSVAAVGPGGVDPETVVLAKEPRGLFFTLERAVVEVGQNGPGIGHLHRQLVVGALPVLDLFTVTTLALLFVDQGGRRSRGGWCLHSGGAGDTGRHIGRRCRLAGQQKPAEPGHDQQQRGGGHREQVTGSQGRGRIRGSVYRFVFMGGHYDFRGPDALAIPARFF
ncbi:hypothetical protein D3C84_672050 [compost metagenome]